MRYIFFGNPEFASLNLKFLIENNKIPIAVVTNPDKPMGRNRKLMPTPVKEVALEYNIPVIEVDKLKDNSLIEKLRSLEPDLFVVVAYRILPSVLLDIPKNGAINLHASLLPDYKGAAPIQYVLLNGEKETGVTTFFLTNKLDNGDIILQKRVEIKDFYNAGDLYNVLLKEGSQLLLDTLDLIERGNYPTRKQEDGNWHYAPKIQKKDMRINWNETAERIRNKVRAFSPYPGAFCYFHDRILKIFDCLVIDDKTTGNPGEVLLADEKKGLYVQTGKGIISVLSLQLQGKKRLGWSEFLRGTKIQRSDFFS